MKARALAASVGFVLISSSFGQSVDLNYPKKDSSEAKILRGNIVFTHYCMNCHGVDGSGRGRSAKLYDPKPANLRASPYNDTYKELIIRSGGVRLGRSEFMPAWNDELTDEQIADVLAYLASIVSVADATR